VSEAVTRLLRRATTRMNYRLLYAVCGMIAAGLRVLSHYPYRILSRIPGLAGLARKLPLHDHHRYPFKVVVADAFDRLSVPLVRYYTDDDLRGWLRAAGWSTVRSCDVFVTTRAGGCSAVSRQPLKVAKRQTFSVGEPNPWSSSQGDERDERDGGSGRRSHHLFRQ